MRISTPIAGRKPADRLRIVATAGRGKRATPGGRPPAPAGRGRTRYNAGAMPRRRLVELGIWLLTGFFVAMMFAGLGAEILRRHAARIPEFP